MNVANMRLHFLARPKAVRKLSVLWARNNVSQSGVLNAHKHNRRSFIRADVVHTTHHYSIPYSECLNALCAFVLLGGGGNHNGAMCGQLWLSGGTGCLLSSTSLLQHCAAQVVVLLDTSDDNHPS